MRIVLLLFLLFSALNHFILSQNEESWINEGYPDEVNLLEADLQTALERVSRAPGLQQVFGLMGKRSSARSQITRRRQKFQTFVGLMGKRNVAESGESDILLSLPSNVNSTFKNKFYLCFLLGQTQAL
nr:protachykinin-1-like isoform X1 [Danio rerio]|eukprot:XP_005158527.1 protachykinin-1-like isoform X1 [Danio rerio]